MTKPFTARVAQSFALGLLGLAALSCNTAAIKRSYMSLDQDGSRHRTVFYTDTESIYCIAEMAIGRKDVTVTAALRATALTLPPSGASEPTDQILAVKDITPGGVGSDVIATFQLVKPDMKQPWQAGKFVCELSIDGKLEESVPFEVRYPTCPMLPPRQGESCAGFFLPDSRCVGAIVAQSCTCDAAGTWQCQ